MPAPLWVVLILTVCAAIGGLALLGHPGARRPVQLGVLVTTTVVFALTLLLVQDLDRPYDGWVRIEPSAMLATARRIAALPGSETPPCDSDGVLSTPATPSPRR